MTRPALRLPLVPSLPLLLLGACGGGEEGGTRLALADGGEASATAQEAAAAPGAGELAAAVFGEEPPLVMRVTQPLFDDWEGILERRVLRVLVTRSRTAFFVAAGRGRGFELEMFREFEKEVNAELDDDGPPFKVAYVPVEQDRLLDALVEGHGDVAAALLTVTPEREARVAFSEPYIKDVAEVVVHARGAERIEDLDGLSGKRVFVAKGTSYVDTLARLNDDFAARGLAPVEVLSPGRALAQEDYLEMVAAGILDYTVCDRFQAELWAQVLDGLVVRPDLPLTEGGHIAWAVRQGSPGLAARLDAFAARNRKGTLIGNVLFKRYFAQTRWVAHPLEDVGEEVLGELRAPIQRYAEEYGFDWRLIAAQAYQESGLDPAARSRSGAIGLMQLLPATAKDMGFDDVTGVDDNLHAGVKYMAWLRDHYFSDESVPEAARVDFALAAYNAGVGRVRRWRREAPELGIDPDRWFGQVERIAMEDVGMQPVQYVGNINKYVVAFTLLLEEGAEERAEMEQVEAEYGPGQNQ